MLLSISVLPVCAVLLTGALPPGAAQPAPVDQGLPNHFFRHEGVYYNTYGTVNVLFRVPMLEAVPSLDLTAFIQSAAQALKNFMVARNIHLFHVCDTAIACTNPKPYSELGVMLESFARTGVAPATEDSYRSQVALDLVNGTVLCDAFRNYQMRGLTGAFSGRPYSGFWNDMFAVVTEGDAVAIAKSMRSLFTATCRLNDILRFGVSELRVDFGDVSDILIRMTTPAANTTRRRREADAPRAVPVSVPRPPRGAGPGPLPSHKEPEWIDALARCGTGNQTCWDQELGAALAHGMELPHHRSRRFIFALAGAAGIGVGLYALSKVNELAGVVGRLASTVERLSAVVEANTLMIEAVSNQLTEFVGVVKQTFENLIADIKRQFDGVYEHMNELLLYIQQVYLSLDFNLDVWEFTAIIQNLVNRYGQAQISMLAAQTVLANQVGQFRSAVLDLKAGHIPSALIPPSQLMAALNEPQVRTFLQSYNMRPPSTNKELMDIYLFGRAFAFVIEPSGTLVLSIEVPLFKQSDAFDLFSYQCGKIQFASLPNSQNLATMQCPNGPEGYVAVRRDRSAFVQLPDSSSVCSIGETSYCAESQLEKNVRDRVTDVDDCTAYFLLSALNVTVNVDTCLMNWKGEPLITDVISLSDGRTLIIGYGTSGRITCTSSQRSYDVVVQTYATSLIPPGCFLEFADVTKPGTLLPGNSFTVPVISSLNLQRNLSARGQLILDSGHTGGDAAAIFNLSWTFQSKDRFDAIMTSMNNRYVPSDPLGGLTDFMHEQLEFQSDVNRTTRALVTVLQGVREDAAKAREDAERIQRDTKIKLDSLEVALRNTVRNAVIGICLALGVAILAGVVYLCCMRRRAAAGQTAATYLVPSAGGRPKERGAYENLYM